MGIDLLIFDMDGVLIDVSRSYRQTILKTVELYLRSGLGFEFEKDKKLITSEEISLFKWVGGFNNDWDLTAGILLYLISLSGLPSCKTKRPFNHIHKLISFIRERSKSFPKDLNSLLYKKDLDQFLRRVKFYNGGLKGVRLALKDSWDGWVYHQGDLNRENLVQRIFQEVYLGEKFTFYYHLPTLFYHGKGLYLKERLLFPRRVLASLRRKIPLGIASGRPRVEAELALKRFQIDSYFDYLVTLDDCIDEEDRAFLTTGKRKSYSKPHPFSLFRVIEEANLSSPQCAYIGDSVDDMRAAQKAKKRVRMLAIGYTGSSPKKRGFKESLLQAGADIVLSQPEQVLRWVGKN